MLGEGLLKSSTSASVLASFCKDFSQQCFCFPEQAASGIWDEEG